MVSYLVLAFIFCGAFQTLYAEDDQPHCSHSIDVSIAYMHDLSRLRDVREATIERALQAGQRPTIIFDTLRIVTEGATELKSGEDIKEVVEKAGKKLISTYSDAHGCPNSMNTYVNRGTYKTLLNSIIINLKWTGIPDVDKIVSEIAEESKPDSAKKGKIHEVVSKGVKKAKDLATITYDEAKKIFSKLF